METTQPPARRSGRPDATASGVLDRHILDTATGLFARQGYAATSIEQVAAAAGAGKQTIYRRYASKEDLFKAVITALSAPFIAAIEDSRIASADPLTALRETCRATLDFAARPDVVAVYRILIAEAQRFPALIDHTARIAIDPFEDVMRRLLAAARDAGQIKDDCDIVRSGRALSGLVTGWLLQRALLRRENLEDPGERTAFFQIAWELFLGGVAPP